MAASRPLSRTAGLSGHRPDFNGRFGEWLTRVNGGVMRAAGAAPVDRLDTDRVAMVPPPVVRLGWRNRVRLDTQPSGPTRARTPATTPLTLP